MMPLEQAQTAILQAIRPVSGAETVALAQAHGRYCAEDLQAHVDHPGFDNSSMDGYAVNVGDAPQMLAPGTAMRIYTGAPMPHGANAVAIQEDVQLQDGRARIPRTLEAGENLRCRGEDFRAGEVLYGAGRKLRATDIALLATAG